MSHKFSWLLAGGIAALLAACGWWFAQRRVLPPDYDRGLVTEARQLTCVRFSPQDRHVIGGGAAGEVIVGDLTTHTSFVLEPASQSPVITLAFSPDSLLLASGLSGELRAWTYPDLKFSNVESPHVPVTAIVFRKTTSQLSVLLGLADGRIATLAENKVTLRQSGHRGVKAMTLTQDGNVLITAGTEGRLIWFDLKQDVKLATKEGHKTELAHLVWSPDRARLATADWNGHLCIWNVETRDTVGTADQPDAVSGLAWRSSAIVTGSWDGQIRVWSEQNSALQLERAIATGRPIHGLDVSEDGTRAVTVSATSEIDVWKLR